MCEFCGIDEFPGAQEEFAGGQDLFAPVGGEEELGGAGVAAIDGPFGLSVAG